MPSTKMVSLHPQIVTVLIVAINLGFGGLSYGAMYDAVGLMRGAGYAGERHRVATADGFVLTLHRLRPARPPLPARPPPPPVLLQHGLWSSSYYWLAPGPGRALPFLLSDAGYDVWLSNSRGNRFSREHVSLSPDQDAYWDNCFHEMGELDLPAVLEYVSQATGCAQMHVVGHSLGATQLLVLAALRPELLAARVRFAVAMAPVATVGPLHGPLRALALALHTFLKDKPQLELLNSMGISTKTIIHLSQLYLTGEFKMFDYGAAGNMRLYGVATPPAYALANVSVPVLLCYGTEDPFATKNDVEALYYSLPNAVDIWAFPYDHSDFVIGSELFNKIIVQLQLAEK